MNQPLHIATSQDIAELRQEVMELKALVLKLAPVPKPQWVTVAEFCKMQSRYTSPGRAREAMAKWKAEGIAWVRGGNGKQWEIEFNGYQESGE